VMMAIEYRQKFHSDVFIDLLGYRKYGHNEADEPRFTQPEFYKIIASHPDPRRIYTDKLVKQGDITQEKVKALEGRIRKKLQSHLDDSKKRVSRSD